MSGWGIKKAAAIKKLYQANRLETWFLVAILLITAITHGLNMTQYPYFENDEATYISRGWSVVSDGTLDPYTYRYDHAPVGWLVIAAWQLFTAGTALFGSFLVSGRFLMLLVSLATAILTYVLSRRFTGSRFASLLAVLIVTISPLAIYFQRRVLLDNIMTLFILVSMYFASDPKRKLGSFQLSGLTFGLAVLSKFTALFALPAVLLLVMQRASKVNRLHLLIQWLGIVVLIVSLFITYAGLKGEILTANLDANGVSAHVSLIETTREQLGRGIVKLPWDSDSFFYKNMSDWFRRDAFLMLAGLAAVFTSVFFGLKQRAYLVITLYCLGFLLFFTRGKLVLNHYILPLLPGLAFAIALVIAQTKKWLKSVVSIKEVRYGILAGLAVSISFINIYYSSAKPYRVDENSNLIAAQSWVVANIDPGSLIIMDNYAYPDLRYKYGYQKSYYMFPAEYDPAVRKAYGNDWRNIQYILVTHEIYTQMQSGTLPTIKLAYDHAYPLAEFKTNSTSYIDEDKLISTNGDWAAIYRVDPNYSKVSGVKR